VRKTYGLLLVLFCSTMSPLLHADIAAIQADKLPQETAVLAALGDAREMEPYSHVWSPEWNFPLSKKDVARHLGKDMDLLVRALKNHPENEELALLTGLVARYGYNVDVKDSPDVAMNALSQAETIDPTDLRAPWFHATFFCETFQAAEGEREFLSLEASHPWDRLPPAFWIDYMECASLTNMPVHVLRAANYLEKLHAAATPLSNTCLNKARKRLEPFDPKKVDPTKIWRDDSEGSNNTLITSTTCGVRLQVRENWKFDALDMVDGACVATFNTGPYNAVTGTLKPEIMVLVQHPPQGETLVEFAMKFLTKGTYGPNAPTRCPVDHCIALKGERPGMYAKNGDGHPHAVVFERDEPAFPGLIFETPSEVPKPDKPGAFKFSQPDQIQQRIPGKLYYLVLLDTSAATEEPALKDLDFFLENLTVE